MILLDRLPLLPFLDPQLARLPGLAPLPPGEWICDWPDTAAQLRDRERLIAERRGDVLDCLPEGRAAAAELLEVVLGDLATRPGWAVGEQVTTPAGPVAIVRDDPLAALGRIVTEDFCLMAPAGEEYRLVGAILCFPSHWRLAEKIGHPMTAIHDPVPQYDDEVGMRVNRFFRRVPAGALLYRVNWSLAETPDLFTPDPHARMHEPLYLRIERQTFLRLPESGVIAFGIRTGMAALDSLTAQEAHAFAGVIDELSPEAKGYKGGRGRLEALRARLVER